MTSTDPVDPQTWLDYTHWVASGKAGHGDFTPLQPKRGRNGVSNHEVTQVLDRLDADMLAGIGGPTDGDPRETAQVKTWAIAMRKYQWSCCAERRRDLERVKWLCEDRLAAGDWQGATSAIQWVTRIRSNGDALTRRLPELPQERAGIR